LINSHSNCSFFPDHRCNAGGEEFHGVHDLGMRKRAGSELNRDAGDAAEDVIGEEDLLGNR